MRLPDYELLEKLNHDGLAQLYRARDPEGRLVMLHDTSRPGAATEPAEEVESFIGYLREVAQLDHPNIEHVTEVGTQSLWFAAEYFDWDLSLDRRIRAKEKTATAEKVRIVLAILAALDYAHGRGLVHTAVNPTNVFVLASGEVKVLNFASGWHTRRALRRGTLSGATHYLAPEFILDGVITPAMDLFATGVLLYRLLVEVYPFHGKDGPAVLQAILHEPMRPLGDRCAECADRFAAILQRALAKDPKDRFPSAAAFGEALRATQS